MAATPVSGPTFVRSFLLLAQGQKILVVTPTSISYATGIAAGAVLANLSAIVSTGTAAPSWSLGPDCAGLDIAMKASGELDVGAAPLAGEVRCHVVAIQAGVANSPLSWPVHVYHGAYTGPADVNGAIAGYSLNAISGAAATAGVSAMQIFRDNDYVLTDVTVLPSGDLDLATAARFCAPTICEGWIWRDQTGSGNDEPSWGKSRGLQPGSGHNPFLVFNAEEANPNVSGSGSLPAWSFSNGDDNSWWNAHFTKSASAATLMAVAIASINDGVIVHSDISSNSSSGAELNYATSSDVTIGAGKVGAMTILGARLTTSAWHLMQGVVNGNASALYVDAAAPVTGTLPTGTFFANSLGIGGDYDGGGMNGFVSEVLVLPPETPAQAAGVCHNTGVPWAC